MSLHAPKDRFVVWSNVPHWPVATTLQRHCISEIGVQSNTHSCNWPSAASRLLPAGFPLFLPCRLSLADAAWNWSISGKAKEAVPGSWPCRPSAYISEHCQPAPSGLDTRAKQWAMCKHMAVDEQEVLSIKQLVPNAGRRGLACSSLHDTGSTWKNPPSFCPSIKHDKTCHPTEATWTNLH